MQLSRPIFFSIRRKYIGKVLVAGGCRNGLCEKNSEAAPCQIWVISCQLQRDTPLSRADPVSDIICASVRADLGKGGKKTFCTTAAGRAVSEKQPCTHRGGGGAPGTRAEDLLQPVVYYGRVDIHAAVHVELVMEQVDLT